MKSKFNVFSWIIISCFTTTSCTDMSDVFESNNDSRVSLDIRMATHSEIDKDNILKNIKGFIYSEGTLTKTIDNIVFEEGKPCNIIADFNDGDHFYMLSESDVILKGFTEEKKEETFLKLLTSSCDKTNAPVYMSGYAVLKKSTQNQMTMRRGVARIDVNPDAGISVKKIVLDNVGSSGFVFEQKIQQALENVPTTRLETNFNENPITELRNGVFYLYEQSEISEQDITASVTFSKNGESDVTKTILMPKGMKRNKVYTLALKLGQNVSLTVQPSEWGIGDETDLSPDFSQKIDINIQQSVIPNGARFSTQGDTLYMPYWGGNATISFSSGNEIVCESADATRVPVISKGENKFEIKTPYMGVDKLTEFVDLNLKIKGMTTKLNSLTIVLTENVVGFYNDKELKTRMPFANGICDFKRYTDGTLGYLKVPKDFNVSTEGIWIRLDETTEVSGNADEKVYSIEGGYKPNDPEADGREQQATIKIQNNNGITEIDEEYIMKRRNFGLPVVEINGVYWCKYNLQGNAKSFEDQVSIRCDRDTVASLENFLKGYLIENPNYPGWGVYLPNSVKDMELFYSLLGHGYQSGNTQGMPYKGRTTFSANYHYPGYNTYYPEYETGLLPADSLAPDGYKVPEYSDFRKLVPSDNFQLGKQNETKTYNIESTQISVEVFYMGTMAFNMNQFYGLENRPEYQGNFNVGGAYGTSFYYIFKEQGKEEPLILMGNPYQDRKLDGGSQTVTSERDVAFVCHNSSAQAWMLTGNKDTEPTYLKKIGGNSSVVKMIRCVKKPVKYIIK